MLECHLRILEKFRGLSWCVSWCQLMRIRDHATRGPDAEDRPAFEQKQTVLQNSVIWRRTCCSHLRIMLQSWGEMKPRGAKLYAKVMHLFYFLRSLNHHIIKQQRVLIFGCWHPNGELVVMKETRFHALRFRFNISGVVDFQNRDFLTNMFMTVIL